MQEKFKKFMIGRYGTDELARCLLTISLFFLVLSFFKRFYSFLFIVLALLIICYYRMFSKNIQRRYEENQFYLKNTQSLRQWFVKTKNKIKDRKVYHIYTCPDCKQKIRIPRGKGKICITCPKCKKEFIKKA